MKFFTFFLFLTLGSFNFLGASTTAPEVLSYDSELIVEAFIFDFDDEVCYTGSVSVEIGGIGADIEVSSCAATASEAWCGFLEAMEAPFQ